MTLHRLHTHPRHMLLPCTDRDLAEARLVILRARSVDQPWRVCAAEVSRKLGIFRAGGARLTRQDMEQLIAERPARQMELPIGGGS